MDTYSFLREFADSWFLIAMVVFFLGTWVFAFWPGARRAREDAANIPFRDENAEPCDKSCANCACGADFLKGLPND